MEQGRTGAWRFQNAPEPVLKKAEPEAETHMPLLNNKQKS